MSVNTSEAAVYSDIEKMHRVLGYYEGQENKPLDEHLRHIDINLEYQLRAPQHYIRRIHYDLNLDSVISAKHIVWKAEKLELSLLYCLFSEGVQSLIVLRDVTASEIKDWCGLIRKTLIDFDQGAPEDLSSVLWRAPFRNLRSRIYNSLQDMLKEESAPSNSHWHFRDKEWSLPSAENLNREAEAYETLEEDQVGQIKKRMKDVQSGRDDNDILAVGQKELQLLAEELSSYDQDQVEFNLLNLEFEVAQSSAEKGELKNIISKDLQSIGQSIVARFHPSLIFYVIKQIESLKEDRFDSLRKELIDNIAETLRRPSNEKRLISALRDPERRKISEKLFPFLDYRQFPAIVDFYLEVDDKDSFVEFLKVILGRDLDADSIFLSWGDDRLSAVLPLFRRLEWPTKYQFLERAIRSPHPKTSKQASYYLMNITIDPDVALQCYSKLADEVKEIWLKSLNDSPVKDSWRLFVLRLIQSNHWRNASNPLIRSRLMMGWVELGFKYLKGQAFQIFESFVRSRKFLLFPKYPAEREAILLASFKYKKGEYQDAFNDWIRSESRVAFQSSDLKQRLKSEAGRSL